MADSFSINAPSISVQRRFMARHAVTINGQEEELHEHDWHVRIEVAGPLDDEGLLIDFHLLEAALDATRGDSSAWLRHASGATVACTISSEVDVSDADGGADKAS